MFEAIFKMEQFRKTNDVWKEIDQYKPNSFGIRFWRNSFLGVKTVLEQLGFILQMNEETFQSLPIPTKKKRGTICRSERKVIVSRHGILSKPVKINDLITGHVALLTNEEKYGSYA